MQGEQETNWETTVGSQHQEFNVCAHVCVCVHFTFTMFCLTLEWNVRMQPDASHFYCDRTQDIDFQPKKSWPFGFIIIIRPVK